MNEPTPLRNNVTLDFVRDAAKGVDLYVEHMKKCGHERFGYIMLSLQNGEVTNMTSCSNLPPNLMMNVLRVVAFNVADANDVTAETSDH